jgi:purine-binding chemotaxis protein CheW
MNAKTAKEMRVFVLFAIGEGLYALPREAVREILPLPRLWRPPGAPASLAGMLNLGGDAVPVLSLRALFQIPGEQAPNPYQHILLLHGLGETLGLLTDQASDVIYVEKAKLKLLAPAETLNGCAEAELDVGGGIFAHVLSPGRLLLQEERVRLAELRATAAARIAEWSLAADAE